MSRIRKHPQLYGLMWYPCSINQEEHEETIYSSKYATKSNFKEEYENYMAAMRIVAEAAKIYVLNNWEKVTDWTNMEISIVDNSGKETYYYNYIEEVEEESINDSDGFGKIRKRFRTDMKESHNPVKEVKDVELDTSDGDFSLTINGKEHYWIDSESVVILADYIEKQLNKK